MSIVGSQQQIEKTKKVIYSLLKLIVSGVSISRRDVIYAQKLVEKDKLDQLSELYKGELEASEVTLFIPSVFMPAIDSELAVGEIEKRYFSLSLNPVWLEVSCKALSLPELSITCDVIPREALFMRSESLLSI